MKTKIEKYYIFMSVSMIGFAISFVATASASHFFGFDTPLAYIIVMSTFQVVFFILMACFMLAFLNAKETTHREKRVRQFEELKVVLEQKYGLKLIKCNYCGGYMGPSQSACNNCGVMK